MLMATPPSYLTCTASQAQEFNEQKHHHIQSLNQLLEHRAISHPDLCVAGFPEHDGLKKQWTLLTFSETLALISFGFAC